MAGTLILDDDLMVLQRKGDFDIKDDYYETNFPDQFPNIRIDTDIFHFSGEDLRYSVVEYCLDSGRFVRIDGDIMRGNLEIHVPFSGEVEDGPDLVLKGFQAGAAPYAKISLTNRARTSGFTQTIEAIGPTDSSTRESHLKVGSAAITDSGQIMMSGTKLQICALSAGATLNYITANEWDPTTNFITTDVPSESKRLSWDANGGNLYNKLGNNVVRWDDTAVYIRGQSDTIFRVAEDFARYTGVIKDQFDITHKLYVDTQDSKSIPLRGTREENLTDLGYELQQYEVTGPIDFTEDAALNATVNNRLKFTRNNSIKLTIGGSSDDNVHLHNCDFNFHDNKLLNVPDPDESNTDPDAKNAVPKRYIDAEVQELKDLFDNIADIAAPPGMINAFTGAAAPDGWFICDGSSYRCGDHPKMYLALGGNQSQLDTNPDQPFNLPNLSGKFLSQKGGGSGNSLRVITDQRTAVPDASHYTGNSSTYPNDYKGLMHTIDAGNHVHYMNFWDHTHDVGNIKASAHMQKQASNDNGGGDGEFTDPDSGRQSVSDDKSMRMTGSTANATPPRTQDIENEGYYNSSNNTRYESGGLKFTMNNGGNHVHYIEADQWDEYTRPESYVINWIIKHDN